MNRVQSITVSVALAGIALMGNSAYAQRGRGLARGRMGTQSEPPIGARRSQVPPAENRQQRPQGQGPVMIGPGPHTGDWLRHYRSLPRDQQEKMLESDPAFHKLPKDQQSRLKD